MNPRCLTFALLPVICWVGIGTVLVADVSGDSADTPTAVSFTRDVAPILLARCVACHGEKRTEGEYKLVNFQHLLNAGASTESPIEPGNPDASYLLQLIEEEDTDLRMPKEKQPLAASEIDLLRRWIEEGAHYDDEDPEKLLHDLVPARQHLSPPEVYRAPLPVTALAISPDGSEIAVGGLHEITVWNTVTGDLQRRITNVAERTYDLIYSHDGRFIAAASGIPGMQGEVRLYNVADGQMRQELLRSHDCVMGLAFDTAGQRLAIGAADRTVRLYTLEDGQERLNAQHHADWVYAVAFSKDGSRIISASRDMTAKIIDATTGDLITTYAGHKQPVFDVGFRPDGQQAVSCGADGKIHIWKVVGTGAASGMSETPQDEKTISMMGSGTHPYHSIAITPQAIFGCSDDGSVSGYTLDSWKLAQSQLGHNYPVYAVAHSESTQRLASGDHGGQVCVWNAEGILITTFTAAPGYGR